MATQDVINTAVLQLTELATPSTAVNDIDMQIKALYAQIATLQAQRVSLGGSDSQTAQAVLRHLRQSLGRQGQGPGGTPVTVMTPAQVAAVVAATPVAQPTPVSIPASV